jgi:hypothetical protein
VGDPRIGSELAGYRIEAMIGRGGMGVVYRAEHLRLGRKVALKLLPPELAENVGFRDRFESESRLAAAIDHPNIIPLYEAGDAEGLLFITMRFVDGLDLKALLQREGPLPLERVISIVAQVGGALDAAHARGLVHRDVKPANVLVASGAGPEASDHCYLTDFGLTKDTSSAVAITGTGQFVGTIAYVAPEQIDGAEQGGATDQYALGCVFYECLTGHQPFERKTDLDVIWAHLNDEPPLVSELRTDLPPGIDEVVARAMAKAPEDRHANCAAMVLAARATRAAATVVGRTVVSAVPPRPAPGDATRLSPKRAAAAVAAAADLPAARTRRPPPSEVERSVAARGRGRAGLVVAAAAAVVVAAVAGAVAGRSGGAKPPTAANVAATGGLSLRFPATWETLPAPPAIPGLELRDRIAIGPRAAAGREGLVAGRIPSSGPRLLPAELARPAAGGTPARDTVRLGDVQVFRYARLRPAGFTGVVTVYVLLTEHDRVGIACYAASSSPRFDRLCADVAGSLELSGANALELAPSAAYGKALSELLATVTGQRERGRRRLADVTTSVAQARAAHGLEVAYRDARRRAQDLPAPPAARRTNASIAAALRGVSRAYAAVAVAARRHDAAGYSAAGWAVRRAERALLAAVGGLVELGYDVSS